MCSFFKPFTLDNSPLACRTSFAMIYKHVTLKKKCEPWELFFLFTKAIHSHARMEFSKTLCLHKARNWVKVILRTFVKSECCKHISQITYTFSFSIWKLPASLEISEPHFKMFSFYLSIINLVEHNSVVTVKKFTSRKELLLI